MKNNKDPKNLGFGDSSTFFSLKEINIGWRDFFLEQIVQDYWKKLEQKLLLEEKNNIIFYPPKEKIFRCFQYLCPEKIHVVILGQDPYHQFGQADGLAFSTSLKKTPASLKNILKEVFGKDNPAFGNLQAWEKQGVFFVK